jgi:hypothetical protein
MTLPLTGCVALGKELNNNTWNEFRALGTPQAPEMAGVFLTPSHMC